MDRKNILMIMKKAVIVGIVGLGYAFFIQKTGYTIPCVFYKITGFYCPGCGVSRMCLSLLKGDIKAAFYANPMIMICIPILCLVGVKSLFDERKYRKIKEKQIDRILWGFIIAFLIFGVMRNIPEFSYLAPK